MAGRRIQRGKGKGKDWAEKGVGPDGGGGHPAAEEAPLGVGHKEGEEIDWERIRKLLPEP